MARPARVVAGGNAKRGRVRRASNTAALRAAVPPDEVAPSVWTHYTSPHRLGKFNCPLTAGRIYCAFFMPSWPTE